jgi:hypothetical protein
VLINNSRGKEAPSQRDNKYSWTHPKNPKYVINWSNMCNGTSLCFQHYYDVGDDFPKGKWTQWEDNYLEFLMSSREVMEFYRKVSPQWAAEFERGDSAAYGPNMIHAVLEYSFNLWFNKRVIEFTTAAPISKILSTITGGRTVTSSATFPYKTAAGALTTLGHINVLVGLETNDDESVKSIIADDPYGNVYKNFRADTGDNVVMTYADFIKWYKPTNDTSVKFAYFTVE